MRATLQRGMEIVAVLETTQRLSVRFADACALP